jgi:hypothetical protein
MMVTIAIFAAAELPKVMCTIIRPDIDTCHNFKVDCLEQGRAIIGFLKRPKPVVMRLIPNQIGSR